MPLIDIDPSLTRSDAYLGRYARNAAWICRNTIPPDAAERKNWSDKTVTLATERLMDASFSDADMRLGHANYLAYLCQEYATHGIYVLTPDIFWHTILCEIAAQVRSRPETYASLFTVTPDQKQHIILHVADVTDLPLGDLMVALRSRVPTDIQTFIPIFSTSDEFALIARYAAFADICSAYYEYGTFACGYRAVDVRGEKADWDRVYDNVEKLAANFSSCGDTVLPEYLNHKIRPTLNRLETALATKDGSFFSDILTTERCGSGGEVEVHGWWAEQMYVADYGGKKPENTPSHIARVTWVNHDTERQFSLNVGLFFSVDENGVDVPRWGWVRNEIFEAAEAISYAEAGLDASGYLPFKTEIVRVEAKSRVLSAHYLGRSGPDVAVVDAPYVPTLTRPTSEDPTD